MEDLNASKPVVPCIK